jgi:hypothetical protein
MKGLGTVQKTLVRLLKNNKDYFIQVAEDHRNLSTEIVLSDEDHNDYMKIRKTLFESLLNREIISEVGNISSLEVTVSKYKLKK